ncbi:MAG: hypothetical protein ACLRPV_17865 [Lacrimispora saccharolytica]
MKEFRYDDVPVIETSSGKLKGYYCDGEYIFRAFPMHTQTVFRCR